MTHEGRDPRAEALASYLRQRAADFSMSTDVNDEQHIARAGMALLDAALIADNLREDDERLIALSEAQGFETMPDNRAVFVETPEIRAAMQRPLAGAPASGQEILALLVDTVTRR